MEPQVNQENVNEEVVNPEVPNTKSYNFLINTSNQANLAGTNNVPCMQVSSVLVFVYPYYLDNFNIEGLNINLKADSQGFVWINGHKFNTIEISPGIKILGILQE